MYGGTPSWQAGPSRWPAQQHCWDTEGRGGRSHWVPATADFPDWTVEILTSTHYCVSLKGEEQRIVPRRFSSRKGIVECEGERSRDSTVDFDGVCTLRTESLSFTACPGGVRNRRLSVGGLAGGRGWVPVAGGLYLWASGSGMIVPSPRAPLSSLDPGISRHGIFTARGPGCTNPFLR